MQPTVLVNPSVLLKISSGSSGDVIHERILNSFNVSLQSEKAKKNSPLSVSFPAQTFCHFQSNVSVFLTDKDEEKQAERLHTVVNN